MRVYKMTANPLKMTDFPLEMTADKHWYLLQSKPNQDEKAEQQLLNQHYKVYRPRAKRLRKHRGKVVEKIESLFPRYLFVHLDTANDNWVSIRSTIGVSGIVRFGIKPAQVPDQLILDLMVQEDDFSERAIDLDRFKAGESVLVEEGAFKGLQAVFDCYDNGQQRSFVLLEMMGKLTRLPVNTTGISRL